MNRRTSQVLILTAALSGVLPSLAVAQDGRTEADDPNKIIVYGQLPVFEVLNGLRAESQLDENGIASYGVDTVGDLLVHVLRQADRSGEGPVVLINGQPATGLSEISDLPPEAVTRVQLLEQRAAGLLGQSPNRRVVNVVIRPNHRQLTTRATGTAATAGGKAGADGELNYLWLVDGNRRSLVVKANREGSLTEAERNIVGSTASTPFDLAGNVLAYPQAGGEIDPALSLLAGYPVSVAAVPAGLVSPTLADFALGASRPNVTETGQFRTLLPKRQSYSINGTLSQRLSAATNIALNLTGETERTEGMSGLPSLELVLPDGSPYSPFGSPVTIARYLHEPLRQEARQSSVNAAAMLNSRIGRWRLTLNANYQHREGRTQFGRGYNPAALQAAISAGTDSPFGELSTSLLGGLEVDRTRSSNDLAFASLQLSGIIAKLPAGAVNTTLRLEGRINRSSSRLLRQGQAFDRTLRRDEWLGRVGVNLPLLSQASPLGSVSADVSGVVRQVTAAGTLDGAGYGLNWQPGQTITLRASVNYEKIPPPPNSLTDPLLVTEGYRTYDFLREETVLVRYITGGNPDLGVEKRRTTTVSGQWQPLADIDLDLNAEYSAVRGRDVFAALPPVNAEVQAAFPDRFVRDAEGRLVEVDARLVPFSRVRREELRWGFDLTHTFGSGPVASGEPGGDREGALVPGFRVNAFASHTWALSNTRLARPGLGEVDLLDGGAIGYASGLPRHIVQFGGGVAHKGFGLQFSGNWIGKNKINSGTIAAPTEIRFADRMTVDARMFVNLGPQFPTSSLARGARIAVEADNLFASRQRVADQNGEVPLGYQPYLIDPLGRAIKLTLRKVF